MIQPSYVGALMLVVAILAIIMYLDWAERRRYSCDGCRVEALGSQWPYNSHTCSKRRALFRDRKGRLFVFGRYVGPAADVTADAGVGADGADDEIRG